MKAPGNCQKAAGRRRETTTVERARGGRLKRRFLQPLENFFARGIAESHTRYSRPGRNKAAAEGTQKHAEGARRHLKGGWCITSLSAATRKHLETGIAESQARYSRPGRTNAAAEGARKHAKGIRRDLKGG